MTPSDARHRSVRAGVRRARPAPRRPRRARSPRDRGRARASDAHRHRCGPRRRDGRHDLHPRPGRARTPQKPQRSPGRSRPRQDAAAMRSPPSARPSSRRDRRRAAAAPRHVPRRRGRHRQRHRRAFGLVDRIRARAQRARLVVADLPRPGAHAQRPRRLVQSAPQEACPVGVGPATRSSPATPSARIAARFGVSTRSVLTANGLGWSSIIYPGQTLAIPGHHRMSRGRRGQAAPRASARRATARRRGPAPPGRRPRRPPDRCPRPAAPRHDGSTRSSPVTPSSASPRRFGLTHRGAARRERPRLVERHLRRRTPS